MSEDTKPTTPIEDIQTHLDEFFTRNRERRAYLEGLDGATVKTPEEKTFLELCNLADATSQLAAELATRGKKKS